MSPPNEFCLQGVIITSSWSGMASDCAGAAAVSEKLFDHGLLTSEGVGISVYSTADNDPLCENVLGALIGPCAPEHVFNDLTHKVPVSDLETLQSKLAYHTSLVDLAMAKVVESGGDDKAVQIERRAAIQEHSERFLKFAMKMGARWKFNAHDKYACSKCNKNCRRSATYLYCLQSGSATYTSPPDPKPYNLQTVISNDRIATLQSI